MHKVFVDTDVILDLLLEREPFKEAAYELFRRIELKKIKGYTSPLVMANLHYILTKILGKSKSIQLLRNLLQILSITKIDSDTILQAFAEEKLKDLEDLIQLYSALDWEIDILTTRNIKDYPEKDGIRVVMPGQLISMIDAVEL